MARLDPDDSSIRRRSVCLGTGHRYFRSAFVEVQACGQRNYLWLISVSTNFMGLISVDVACPRKLVPHKNFCVYGTNNPL